MLFTPCLHFIVHPCFFPLSAARASNNHCPLCHQNIATGEEGWKSHLMSREGCKQNPRRLLALNKTPAAGMLFLQPSCEA